MPSKALVVKKEKDRGTRMERLQRKPWLLPRRPESVEDDTVRLYLDGEVTELHSIQDIQLRMSLDEAATITVTIADPRNRFATLDLLDANEDMLLEGVDVRWGRVWWRLTRLERLDNGWTLYAEDRVAGYLRSHTRPVKASRANITRAGFVFQLALGVKAGGGIRCYIPEVNEKQKIARAEVPDETATKSSAGKAKASSGPDSAEWADPPASVSNFNSTFPFNRTRRDVAAQVLGTCERLKAPPKAVLAVVEACLVEQTLLNEPRGDRTSVGFLQLLATHLGGSVSARMNVPKVTALFLQKGFTGAGGAISLAKKNPGWSAGRIAQAVQGSGHPGRYDQSEKGARAVIKAYRGGALSDDGSSASADTPEYYRVGYAFKTQAEGGEKTSWWDAMGSLADEVQWHRWAAGNTLCYASDNELVRGTPVMRLDRENPEVRKLDYVWDYRREASETTATVALEDTWTLMPGMTVMVDDDPAIYGRWIVDTIDISPLTNRNVAELKLRRRGAKKLEPAPEIRQREVKETARKVGGASSYGGEKRAPAGSISGTPEHIINSIVLPMSRKCGVPRTVAQNNASNRAHGPTVSGNRSDHQGPPSQRWAADMSNGGSPTPQMDRLANALADYFGLQRLSMSTSGRAGSKQTSSKVAGGYRYQLIYRSYTGGNHDNHVHFGIQRT